MTNPDAQAISTLPYQYANVPALDFDSAESEKPTQVMDLIDSKDAVEYPVPYGAVSLALRARNSVHTEKAAAPPELLDIRQCPS